MPKAEWGVKRVCPKTGKRFYDLNNDPIISPYTGEVVELETPGGKAPRARAAEKEKPAVTETAEEEVVLDDEDDMDDADVDVDDELLEDDDEDTVALDEIADVASEDDD